MAEKTMEYEMAPAVHAVVVTPAPKSGDVVVPTGAAATAIPMREQEKVGAKCCGCCCDYRRAVIILSVIYICIQVAVLVIYVASISVPYYKTFEDDQVDDQFEVIWDEGTKKQVIFTGISLGFTILALIGANLFNAILVGLNIVWLVANYIGTTVIMSQTYKEVNALPQDDDLYAPIHLSGIPNAIVNAIIVCLIIYPHAGLVHEIYAGIMTPDTYPREEFSCCCVPNSRRR